VPARILAAAGVFAPRKIGLPQVLGLGLTLAGASLALWCIFTFVFAGKGTPAPFDPPRRLVVRGPYRLVRNPMYAGAVLAIGGASLYFRSAALAAYAAAFLGFAAIFVRLYEEPALERTFGAISPSGARAPPSREAKGAGGGAPAHSLKTSTGGTAGT
jgi:protein-S-isoprenylcysteine O-methyltransferase Ste14